jgi:hypothetical protein
MVLIQKNPIEAQVVDQFETKSSTSGAIQLPEVGLIQFEPPARSRKGSKGTGYRPRGGIAPQALSQTYQGNVRNGPPKPSSGPQSET